MPVDRDLGEELSDPIDRLIISLPYVTPASTVRASPRCHQILQR